VPLCAAVAEVQRVDVLRFDDLERVILHRRHDDRPAGWVDEQEA
jgi:hypothetical protein